MEPRVSWRMRAGAAAMVPVISFSPVSIRPVADDSRSLQLAYRRPEVLYGVVLRAAVVPNRHAVATEAEANLVFRHVRLAQQVVEQQRGARIRVLSEAHVLRYVEIG